MNEDQALDISKLGDTDELTVNVGELRGLIDREAAKKAAKAHVPSVYAQPVNHEVRTPYNAYTTNTKGVEVAKLLRAFAVANGDMRKTVEVIQAWQKEVETPEGARLLKTLTEGSFTDGGLFVRQNYSSEIIELLREVSVVRMAGVRVVPIDGGNLAIPKFKNGASAFWRVEGKTATPSTVQFEQLNLLSKELIGLVPISNRLLRHASPAMDVIVRDDLIAALGEKEDATFLRGDGTLGAPKGMRCLCLPDQILLTENSALADQRAQFAKMRLAARKKKVRMRNPAWFINPTVEEFLLSQADANGNLIWAPQMMQGKLGLWPYYSTTSLPDNLAINGHGGVYSEMILADCAELFIGEDGKMETQIARDVTYADSEGNLRSGFANGETVVQVNMFEDFGVRQDEAIVVGQVPWALA